MILLVVLMIAVVAFIVYVERSERRIPVQYAKRVVGRKVMGGQSTHLPLRVNAGGVMPVIFASSILTLPQTMLGHGIEATTAISATYSACLGFWRTAVHAALCGRDYLLRLLLRVDCLQSQRGCRQHAEVWRLYSRHSSGQGARPITSTKS
jgi:branched-subunit amino acid transport protein